MMYSIMPPVQTELSDLTVTFTKKKRVTMSIRMGNDEFILYIRKQYPDCIITNEDLGKRIWQWIRENNPEGSAIIERDANCYWGNNDEVNDFIRADRLPKTAAQISFRRDYLPDLYTFLDLLGQS